MSLSQYIYNMGDDERATLALHNVYSKLDYKCYINFHMKTVMATLAGTSCLSLAADCTANSFIQTTWDMHTTNI